MQKMRTVMLAEELCVRAERKFQNNFPSIDELLDFVLHQLVLDEATAMDRKEEEMIEKRLQDLGYL